MLTRMLVIFASTGGLCIVLSIPLILRRIKPNWLYGFRTARTMSDPGIWYDANAYAGKYLLVSGIIIAVFPVALYLVMPSLNLVVFALVCTAVALIAVLVTVILSLRYLGTLA